MAVFLPIVTEFKDTGIKKAIKEFQSLETASQKAGFVISKAAVPAAAAIAGLAAVGGLAVKSAIDDAAAQQQLATQLRNTTQATDIQIASVEDWIAQTQYAAAVSDSELRPALSNLATATGSVTAAQDLLNLALDISAGSGKSLEQVTTALVKAQNGNVGALTKLGIPLSDSIQKTNDFEAAQKLLAETFNGAAATAAESTAGRFKRLAITMDETKEAIGATLLPAIEKVLPKLQLMANWAQNNTDLIIGLSGALLIVATSIQAYQVAVGIATILTNAFTLSLTAAQIAMIGLITGGIALVVLALVALYVKFDAVKKVVDIVLNAFIGAFEIIVNGLIQINNTFIPVINAMITAANFFGADLDKVAGLSEVSFGRIQSSAERAAEAVDNVQRALQQARNNERKGFEPTFTKKVTAGAGGATKAVVKFGDAVKTKVTAALTDAKKKLDDARKAFKDFSTSVADSLKGGLSASTAFEAGKEAGTSFTVALKEQVAGVKAYSANVQKLLELGLSQEALKFVLAAGAESGAAIAQELINGGADAITTTNALVAAANDAAAVVGDQAASKWYQAGIDQAQALVDGLTTELERLTPAVLAAMDKVAAKWGEGVDVEARADAKAAQIISGATGNIVSTQVEPIDYGALAQRRYSPWDNYTINVNALTPSAEVGRVVVQSLRSMNRSDGPANISIY